MGGKAWRQEKDIDQAKKEKRKKGETEKGKEKGEKQARKGRRKASVCHSKR